MATVEAPGDASGDASGGESPDQQEYNSAREFIVDRLEEEDGTLSPAELAAEYECSNVHARQTLSELADEGVIERVDHGVYRADASGDATYDANSNTGDASGDASDDATHDANSNTYDASGDANGAEDPSVDGEARSEDTDTGVSEAAKMAGPAAAAGGLGLLQDSDRSGQYVLLGLVVLVVLYVVLSSSSDGGAEDASATTEEAAEADATSVAGDEGGLI